MYIAVIPVLNIKMNKFPEKLLIFFPLLSMYGFENYPAGYCQTFSYNIQYYGFRDREKHFFVCCNNLKTNCEKHTYQKPSFSESKY